MFQVGISLGRPVISKELYFYNLNFCIRSVSSLCRTHKEVDENSEIEERETASHKSSCYLKIDFIH